MTDSITARTMFYETLNGCVRFYDWNKVETTLGTMMEPRQLVGVRNGAKDNKSGQLLLKDQCAKVTQLVNANLRDLDALLSDKIRVTVRGTQMPQDFSF